ncbi:MAG: bacteriochlorophyll 4-vinyl reductase [Pseudomonadota bacterium]
MDGSAPPAGAFERLVPTPEPLAAGAGLIGPNAVTQLGHAMRDRLGEAAARRLFLRGGCPGLLDDPPERMIDQRVPIALFRALWRHWPAADARIVSGDAGLRVADYVIANRIPRPAQAVLRLLPAGLACDLLMVAIKRHAWTFAGSGRCEIRHRPVRLISISDNPMAMPDCIWHAAVLSRLFTRLAAPRSTVRQIACCRTGAPACVFEIAPSGARDGGGEGPWSTA